MVDKNIYRQINVDDFPSKMELSFYDNKDNKQTLFYEKVSWNIDGEVQGLRYGENPDQQAAMYKLINGNLVLGDVKSVEPGQYLLSDMELIQSGKHPGKINITDVDSALNILRNFTDQNACVVVKHNNPSGAAVADTLAEAYYKAYMADRIAAFGGAVVVNQTLDKETAELIAQSYSEVVAAPDFSEGAVEILKSRKNLRIMEIRNIAKLQEFSTKRFIEPKALLDGSMIMQWSYIPQLRSVRNMVAASAVYKEKEYKINREPTEQEKKDMLFGWLVEAGVTSNSVIYVKNGVTIGIGTGEQDRVGVAEIAVMKAYIKTRDRICFEKYKTPYNLLEDDKIKKELDLETQEIKGGLSGSVMVSDAFFPFKDGVEVGIKEDISAVIQPGGSIRDFEVIQCCNDNDVTMVFTGQRSFRH